ncbi:transporter substrate-binding domain-containing protein [Candidatus Epulonipiscium viviparus]|uniref:transporter substrate-binding domain-containing protein n=1 Tax=Candidatus Epulonipiscium viviparus TaxID=420336 RepID=UPI002738145E|nr:transporter substrate-binding domain-containing protein [Candidatus Epulopiscium viviparus]
MKLAKTLLTIGTIILFTGCSDNSSNTFTVGFDASYPPYGYMSDSGEYIGFDLDLATIVCENLGYELIKQPIDWSSKDMELNSGNIDCIWNGFSITPDRLDQYAWSAAYVDNLQVIVVPADSDIETLADLKDKHVVVQSASAASEALNSDKLAYLTDTFADLSENPDYNTAFMNLDAGAADAIAIDIGVATYQLDNRTNKYRILDEPFESEKYGIGFRIDDTELRDAVDAELLKLVENGTYYELGEKYGIDKNMLCLGK